MNQQECQMMIILDETRSITEASKRLYMSQPAITYKLQKIEKDIGTKLFSREKQGLIPTPQGELIIQFAKETIKNYSLTIERLKSLNEHISGTINLGVASTYAQYILPNIINDFQERYPDVNFKIYTGISSVIHDLMRDGKVHIGIFRGDIVWNEHKKLIGREPICVVSKEVLALENLPDKPIINYEMDTYLSDLVNEWWNEHYQSESTISMFVDSLETAKELVRTGLGYSILPGISLISEKELIIQPIKQKNGETIYRYTHAYCRHESFNYLAVKTFYEFLQPYKDESSFDM
ncbi:MAG TPA: LysR family transcriptional regulator [Pseudogracilibacillus sp.]|nr:LysR family transcriptional regulator [Pseudogracilibacillus sp.]